MLTLLRTTSILTLIGLQMILGSLSARALSPTEQPSQDISFTAPAASLPLNPPQQKKFEPDQDNGGPSRTSGAGGH